MRFKLVVMYLADSERERQKMRANKLHEENGGEKGRARREAAASKQKKDARDILRV